ncbi:hypothetical protein [Microbacterium nymphoidis]|uniref:hypothetical protein n=1 Tax=Microbacterium nymphoidis TaxID=2898586 RepID=UPI001E5FDC28|nr:hypothetical protein [Microbacterium nymphoidis]MCD2497741.1 hypothetical protein [Microbacterium nymphoidis]
MTASAHTSQRTLAIHRRVPLFISVGVLVSALALAGCAPEPNGANAPAPTSATSTSAPSPSASAVTTPTPTPEHSAATPVSLDLRLDQLVVTDSEGGEQVLDIRTDAVGVRDALFSMFGEVAPERPDDRYPIDLYRWPGLTLSWIEGTPASASVTFRAASEQDVALTSAGLSVGATVAQVEAAGGEVTAYGTYDDVTAYRLNVEKVPGTSSLANPGEEGERYLSFSVVDGVVTMLGVGDDYSDL